MNKEKIKVSAEVRTILSDLHSQIEYELREDYKDSLEKTTQALLDIKEYIEHEWFKRSQLGWLDKTFSEWELKQLLDIINKALEVKDE